MNNENHIKETGIIVPVKIWSEKNWSEPIIFETIEHLMSRVDAIGAGYGSEGQKWEMQCMMIVPPNTLQQKIIYCWVDEKKRLQFANSQEEAENLM